MVHQYSAGLKVLTKFGVCSQKLDECSLARASVQNFCNYSHAWTLAKIPCRGE